MEPAPAGTTTRTRCSRSARRRIRPWGRRRPRAASSTRSPTTARVAIPGPSSPSRRPTSSCPSARSWRASRRRRRRAPCLRSPRAQFSVNSFGEGSTSGQFVASFIPNALQAVVGRNRSQAPDLLRRSARRRHARVARHREGRSHVGEPRAAVEGRAAAVHLRRRDEDQRRHGQRHRLVPHDPPVRRRRGVHRKRWSAAKVRPRLLR